MCETEEIKTIFLGDSGVGKTSIINTKCCDRFDSDLPPIVGSSSLSLTLPYEGTNVRLKLWDTAGQEQYSSLIPMFSRDSIVAVFVADITNSVSIQNLEKWKKLLRDTGETPSIILAINKIDRSDDYVMPFEDLNEELSEDFQNIVFVSALTGEGIDDLFKLIAREAKNHKSAVGGKKLDVTTNEKKHCCK